MGSMKLRQAFRSGFVVAMAWGAAGCSGSGSNAPPFDRVQGQSDFVSSPPGGVAFTAGGGSTSSTGTGGGLPPVGARDTAAAAAPRTVEETDLYRVEGDRLYYLNGYRGLMVFDITNVDQPKLIGRSAIFGQPVEMIVRQGVATVVVADWFGTMDDGTPFHGSIVRGIDASDPANIRILGEAKLGGWVRDTRVVGDVLYAVSEDYGWTYGWAVAGDSVGIGGGSVSSTNTGPKIVVSSVSFAGGVIRSADSFATPGWGGVFNVTPNAIMFAHTVQPPATPDTPYPQPTQMALDYIDISDPGGKIATRGEIVTDGTLVSYGTDNGRWNLDFADGKTAHVLGCGSNYCGAPDGGYVLATADFSNPDAPALASRLNIAGNGWTPAARFDTGRMYLAPGDGYWGITNQTTPIQVYDISAPNAPRFAGQTMVPGSVWNFTPAGNRLFCLGNDAYDLTTGSYGSKISLRYLDVTDPAQPTVLGTSTFGEGWAWTPAAGTFKAFTKSDADGLVVLPFSGWSASYDKYNNGLQLIEFTPTTLRTSGTANTKGWVERGIFAKGRLLSLSDLSLAVVDYTVHDAPRVIAELPLARNVVDARPFGDKIAQLSSDWWYENDKEHSELRVLPLAQAEENVSGMALSEVPIEGVDARVFHNGSLSYVVSSVRHTIACPPDSIKPGAPNSPCYSWTQQVQVVDLSSGRAVLRGKIALPDLGPYWYGYYYGGFYGCYVWDWYFGSDVVQVGGDVLAFRRWMPQYWPDGQYADGFSSLWVVDLSKADNPSIASTVITRDRDGWWGNMMAIGDTLYTTHYDWYQRPLMSLDQSMYYVKYYLDRIDLSDRSHPVVGARINVPGILVGGSATDPSIIYTIDYRWYSNHGGNEFDVLKLSGDKAYLQGRMQIPGYVGSTFVRGDKAYMSVQQYIDDRYEKSIVQLYQLDTANPSAIVPSVSQAQKGWGWLLGVEGDRALVTSGWGGDGIDIYRLSDGAPVFDQFARTVGWGASSLARQGDQIFLASGRWGVQTINLK